MTKEPVNKIKISREKLEKLYNEEHLSPKDMGIQLSCSDTTIRTKLKEYRIEFKSYFGKCILCGDSFKINNTFQRSVKFCSKKCNDREYYLMVRRDGELKDYSEKTCLYCGKIFIPPLRHPNIKHCNPKCNKKHYVEINKDYFQNYSKKHYEKNMNKIKKRSKKWRDDNFERYKKNELEYSKKNRAKAIVRAQRHYLEVEKPKENKRRKKLGLPLVGEGFKSEMELLVYVHNLFQNYEILTHHRKTLGDWGLQGLELDIYIPKLKLAFEYMGIQHYDEEKFYLLTKYNKKKEDFEAQLYRDRCKKKLCRLKGIILIKIKYDERLSEQLVLSKLKYTSIKTEQQILKMDGLKNV